MAERKEILLYNGEVEITFTEGNHAYYLKENGKKRRLTGVTTFLGVIAKPALINWAAEKAVDYVRQNLDRLQRGEEFAVEEILYGAKKAHVVERDVAAQIGTEIHKWVEAFIKKEKPAMPDDERVLQGVNAFLDWVDQHKVKFISSERIVYSREHDFVGTLDIEGVIGKKRFLIDVKTSNGVYDEARLQTAAYVKADEEAGAKPYDGRIVLRISKESEEEYYARVEKKGYLEVPAYKVFEAIELDKSPTDIDRDYQSFLAAVHLHRWQKEMKNLWKTKQ